MDRKEESSVGLMDLRIGTIKYFKRTEDEYLTEGRSDAPESLH